MRALRPVGVIALGMLLVGLARPSAAWAGEPAPPDAPASETIAASLRTFDEGRAAFARGAFDEARAAFEASNRLQASPNSLLYIGRCLRETGRLASAYVTLLRSAREASARLETTLEQRYAATRDAAAAEALALEPRVPRLTLVVSNDVPDDFELTSNGTVIGRESWGTPLETDPGPVSIRATGRRMRPFELDLVLGEGEARRIDVVAERLPTATLAIAPARWPSGLVVELDGVSVPPSELTRIRELDVGPHRVDATAPSYLAWRWDGTLADRQHARVVFDLEPAPTPPARQGTPPWLFFASAGAAVAVGAVGGGFAVDATRRDRIESARSPLARSPDEREAIRAEGTLANALLVSGAVLGVGAAVLFFTTHWRSSGIQRAGTAAGARR